MRALLDVNVLIALLDAGHVHHGLARAWLSANVQHGWASCPLTQNGCLRILSSAGYPRQQPVAAIAERLREAAATDFHRFWPDDLSVLDPARFDASRWLASRQITDAYLLGLAVRHGGRFVTFDRGLDARSVIDAASHDLVVI